MNINYKALLRQGYNRYKKEGAVDLLKTFIIFEFRLLKEKIGRRGLYNSNIYLNYLYWANSGRGKYNSLPDPFKIVYINPNIITHVTRRGPFPGKFMWQDIGLITGGNWDKSNKSVDEIPKICAIRERFGQNKEWSEIRLDDTRASTKPEWCSRVEELYCSIQKQGYQRQYELLDEKMFSDLFTSGKGYTGIERFAPFDEVVVDIGRDGQFLFVDGRHRLAIAKILDLDKIPVRISARHTVWQRRRESYAKTSNLDTIPDRYRSHPDLQDVLLTECEDVD